MSACANACMRTNAWCPLRFLVHASAHKTTSSWAWSTAIVVIKVNSYSKRTISGRCCLCTVWLEYKQRYSYAIPISKLNDKLKPFHTSSWNTWKRVKVHCIIFHERWQQRSERDASSGHENIFGAVTTVRSHSNRCKKWNIYIMWVLVEIDVFAVWCGRERERPSDSTFLLFRYSTPARTHSCALGTWDTKRMKIRYFSFRHVYLLRSVSKRCPSNSPDMKFSNMLLLFFIIFRRLLHFGWKPVAARTVAGLSWHYAAGSFLKQFVTLQRVQHSNETQKWY